jgi:hypothetical protein
VEARWREMATKKTQELDALIARAMEMKASLARVQECRCQSIDQCGQRMRSAALKA